MICPLCQGEAKRLDVILAAATALVENIRTGTENTRDLCFADAMELRSMIAALTTGDE
jgi:hypothetical protein